MALLVALACLILASFPESFCAAQGIFTPVKHPYAGQIVPPHADLNNDGREDFISTIYGAGFAVLLSTGDGTFAAPVTYALPGHAASNLVVIGDFNDDKQAELAVFGTNGNVTNLYVYGNNGKGAFTLRSLYQVGAAVTGAVAGDFNHDGRMDLAFVAGMQLHVWLGNGQGGFVAGSTTPVSYAGSLMLGDFDGDGLADVAVGELGRFPEGVEVLYGDGKGKFPSQSSFRIGGGNSTFGVGDVNSDGKSDIVASQEYPSVNSYVFVYYGNSSRTWTDHTTIPIANCAGQAAPVVADVNGDGINDLVVLEIDCIQGNNGGGNPVHVGVLTRNADATYNPEREVYTSISTGGLLWPTVVRELHHTKPDIAFTEWNSAFSLVILENTTSGNFPACEPPNAFVGISVCSPAAGVRVASPVRFTIGAAGQVAMRKVEVWVDGRKLVEQLNGYSNYTFLDHSLNIAKGIHLVDIYAAGWDNSLVKKSFQLSVE